MLHKPYTTGYLRMHDYQIKPYLETLMTVRTTIVRWRPRIGWRRACQPTTARCAIGRLAVPNATLDNELQPREMIPRCR